MKHIDKSQPNSQVARQKLEDWKVSFRENDKTLEQLYDEKDGTKLWELLRDKSFLFEALYLEQGGICCYCCSATSRDTLQNHIEHFIARNHDKRLTFEYDNLLHSCTIKETITYVAKLNDTWENIANHLSTTVDILWRLNTHIKSREVQLKDMIKLPKQPTHCGAHKSKFDKKPPTDKVNIINPISLPDCWERFSFDGNGEVTSSQKDDELVAKTIEVLNLNAPSLVDKRYSAYSEFVDDFYANPKVQYYHIQGDLIALREFTASMLTEKRRLVYPFCVVEWSFLASILGLP